MGWSWKSPEHDETAVASPDAVGCLVWLVLILLVVVEVILLGTVDHILGLGVRRNMSGIVGGLTLLNIKLAYWIVDRILSWHGLSRSGRTVETWCRAGLEAAPNNERVEIHVKRGLLVTCGVLCLGYVLAIGSSILLVQDARPYWLVMYAAAAVMAMGSAYFFHELARGKPAAWVDASGVTGYPLRFGFRRRSVPWSHIASCDVETRHDIQGKPTVLLLTLKDPAGERLLTMGFGGLTEDPAPLIKAIKARLPKPGADIDNW